MLSSDEAKHIFEHLAIGGKLGLVATLFVLALVNGDATYIVRKPRLFLMDAVFTGVAGACAARYLCHSRGRMDTAAMQTIFGLLFFFMFAVTREFSGYFSLLSGDNLTAKEAKEHQDVKKPVIYFVGACFVVAVALAAVAHVAPPLAPLDFVFEMLVFATIISLADTWCAYTHAQPVGSAFGIGLVMYSVLHLIFQAGGFYAHLYDR